MQIEIDSQDETGQLLTSLKEMNKGLARIVGEVRTGADSIAIATEQIAAGNTDLSQRTEEQASSLEETASSMEELTSTVKQNADNAQQANQLAISASGVAVQGGDVISQRSHEPWNQLPTVRGKFPISSALLTGLPSRPISWP